MIKFLIFFFFIFVNLQAQTINFIESKYIDALNTDIKKRGQITINKEFIKLSYKNETKTFSFYEDNIIVSDKTKEVLTYENNPELEIFYKLFKSIYSNNKKVLQEYFKIEQQKNLVLLYPNEYLSNVIEKIQYKYTDNILDFLTISFINGDRIKIVQTK